MSQDHGNYNFILIELARAVKMHNFYPDSHPNLDSSLERCYLLFKKKLEEEPEIRWRIDHKGFYYGKIPIAQENRDLEALAKKFFFRRVKEISFAKDLTLSDLKTLLSALKVEPEVLQARGGMEAFIAEKDISGVLVNSLNFEELKKLRDELKEKDEEEEKNESVEEEKEEDPGAEAPSEETAEKEAEAPEQENIDLAQLLDSIKRERDFLKYKDTAVRIKEKADILSLEKKFDELLPVLLVFYDHTIDFELPEDIKQEASTQLASFLKTDVLKFLVAKAGGKDESDRTAIQKILVIAGAEAIELLLDEITAAEDAISRRNLYNSLVLFGGGLRPFVERRLDSKEWYVVRQMVSLLGELGDEESAEAIINAYEFPDKRVKKEVLKSLAKVRSHDSIWILIKALEEEDEVLVKQAIISLGMLKDQSSIDALARIALKDRDHEIRKEAIKALGHIRSEKAIPYLRKILFRKVWFGKKYHEGLRSLAAYSLGMIGSAEAFTAVEAASRQSDGELYSACKRILAKREN